MGLFGRTLGLVKAAVSKALSNYSCSELNDATTGLTFAQRQLIQAVNTLKTGQTTSFRTGDDGDLEYGRGASFSTLDCQNPFGTTARFTDELGTQIYANDLVVDWLTGLMWYRSLNSAIWNQAIDNSLSATTGGYSDWFLPNINQLYLLQDLGLTSVFNYSPFSITVSLWSSTTQPTATTSAQRTQTNGLTTASAKSGAQSYIYCRYFTLADLGF